VGLTTHWVLTKVSGLFHPPFPGFAWRTQIAVKTLRHLNSESDTQPARDGAI
jgi:hypothetical protein